MDQSPLLDLFSTAVRAADPFQAVLLHLSRLHDLLTADGGQYDLSRFSRILVIGAGKAAGHSARAIELLLGDRITQGMVITKYGHAVPLERIAIREAGHPLPDQAGVAAAEELIELMKAAGDDTLVLCLFSGGASSLLVAPAAGVSLDDKRATTDLLLKAGATITELNTVRKHLSAVKGGRLAELAYPATVLTLLLSDVIGDRLDVIASGPTVPDPTTFRDALGVVHKYSLERKIPGSVFSLLHMGKAGVLPDTPKEGAAVFQKSRTIIVGSNRQSLEAVHVRAEELGLDPEIVFTELEGEARAAAAMLAKRARETRAAMKPGDRRRLLIAGGETTVTIRGRGTGGRNQELALAFAKEIAGTKGITLLSCGTDGTDGPTDAAGAVVDGETASKAEKVGLDLVAYLNTNDSYTFFHTFDSLANEQSHILTGPTGTNVMDLQLILVEAV